MEAELAALARVVAGQAMAITQLQEYIGQLESKLAEADVQQER